MDRQRGARHVRGFHEIHRCMVFQWKWNHTAGSISPRRAAAAQRGVGRRLSLQFFPEVSVVPVHSGGGDGTLILVAFLKHCLAPSPLVASPSVCSLSKPLTGARSHVCFHTHSCSQLYAFSRVLTLHSHFPAFILTHPPLPHSFPGSLILTRAHFLTLALTHALTHRSLSVFSPLHGSGLFLSCLPLLRDRPAPSGLPARRFPGSCLFAFTSRLKPS